MRAYARPSVFSFARLLSQQNVISDDENDKAEKIVILGTGWGGFNLANTLEKKDNRELYVVSPSNHFVSLFTPSLII